MKTVDIKLDSGPRGAGARRGAHEGDAHALPEGVRAAAEAAPRGSVGAHSPPAALHGAAGLGLQAALLAAIMLRLRRGAARTEELIPASASLAAVLAALTLLPFHGARGASAWRRSRPRRGSLSAKLALARLGAVGAGDAVCCASAALMSGGGWYVTLVFVATPFLLTSRAQPRRARTRGARGRRLYRRGLRRAQRNCLLRRRGALRLWADGDFAAARGGALPRGARGARRWKYTLKFAEQVWKRGLDMNIEIQNLTKRFGKKTAVDSVSLSADAAASGASSARTARARRRSCACSRAYSRPPRAACSATARTRAHGRGLARHARLSAAAASAFTPSSPSRTTSTTWPRSRAWRRTRRAKR